MSYLFARLASSLLATCLVGLLPAGHGGKLLVVPLEGSHWVNMDIIIQALHSNGHEITVVRNTKSWYIKEHSSYYNSVTVSVTEGFDEDFVKPILNKLFDIERGKVSSFNFINLQMEMTAAMYKGNAFACETISNMFEDKALMSTLKDSQYDLVLTDSFPWSTMSVGWSVKKDI